MNTIGYFEIQSANPKREIEFYNSVFGWTFIREYKVPIEYYRIETNSINGGLLSRQVILLEKWLAKIANPISFITTAFMLYK